MIRKIFTNSAGILTSRILGFLRDLLSASILGANIYSDIFFVAFKLPNLFRRIFAEGAFIQSFLPSFAAAKHKNLFAMRVFIRFFLFLLLFSLIVTFWSPFFTKLIAIGFDRETVQLAAPYVALNFYYLDFIFCVTFLAALLQYKEHFATTAFSTALLNLSLITALLLYRNYPKEEIVWAMSVAVVVGGFLQFGVHLWMSYRLNIAQRLFKAIFFLSKDTNDDLHRFQANFIPAIWGNSTPQISAFLDTWLASFLAAGTISYLYYANRILQLPLALFAIATATALFPTISKAIKNGDEAKALLYLKKSFWFLLFLLSFATVGGVALSKEIIWLLFERGSFSHYDTLATAKILVMYMLGLLPFGLAKLFSLWLYARHEQKRAAKFATLSLLTNITFSLLLLKPMGAAGLALASTLSGWLLLFLNLKAFGKRNLLALSNRFMLILLLFSLGAETALLFWIKNMIKLQ